MTDDAPLQREPGWYWVRRRSDGREVIACYDGDGYWQMPHDPIGQAWRETGPKEFAPFTEVISPRILPPGEPVPKTITCPTCDGRGDIGPRKSAEGDMLDQPCPQCEGWGYVTPTGYIAYLIEDRNNSNRLLDECRHERNVLQKICAERSDEIERVAAPKAEAEASDHLECSRGLIGMTRDERLTKAAPDLYRAVKALLSAVDHLAGHLGHGWQSQDASREGQEACDFAESVLARINDGEVFQKSR